HWYGRMQELGFRPLLSDSNGAGGFHLMVLFREPVPTPSVFAFAQWLVRDYGALGMTAPEVFPKQARIKPCGFGNWLRLPGRHHSRAHWSRVWNGSSWLEGAAAIDEILRHDGDAATLIPAAALVPKLKITIRSSAKRH